MRRSICPAESLFSLADWNESTRCTHIHVDSSLETGERRLGARVALGESRSLLHYRWSDAVAGHANDIVRAFYIDVDGATQSSDTLQTESRSLLYYGWSYAVARRANNRVAVHATEWVALSTSLRME